MYVILLEKVEVVEVEEGVSITRKPQANNFKDLTGLRFGRIIVLEFDFIRKKKNQSLS